MAFDYEPDNRYRVVVDLDSAETTRLGLMAEKRGVSIEELVQDEVRKLREPEPFRVAPVEDVRYIVVQGFPKDFHRGYDEAKQWAIEQAERSQEPFTIMAVHKNSLEIAMTALYHGVQVHAIGKARELLVEGD